MGAFTRPPNLCYYILREKEGKLVICPRCKAEFSVREVKDDLYFHCNVDYDDLPEKSCFDCALDYIRSHMAKSFDEPDYDPDDPESYY